MTLLRNIAGILRINTKNWRAMLLCLMAATIFWFFNALNKNYTANLSVPVKIDFDHERFMAVSELPDEVRINLSGVGWSLFRRSIGLRTPPLAIPLDQPNQVRKIPASSLPAIFSSQMEDLQINYILTDTLYLHVEKRESRMFSVTVVPDSLSLSDGFELISEITIQPNSIVIEGPQNMLNEMKGPIQLEITKRNIDRDFSESISLSKKLNSFLKSTPEEVKVEFKVMEFIPLHDSASIVLFGVPARVNPILDRKKVNVVYTIRKDRLKDFQDQMPEAVLDLSNLRRGQHKVLPKIYDLPEYVRLEHIDSVSIKFYQP